MTTTEQKTAGSGDRTASGGKAATGRSAATTASSRRAYERRQRRTSKITASRLVTPGKPVTSALNRAPFVVMLIALLGAGIAGVLYLNTMTDEAGMRTSTAKTATSDLRLEIEALQRDVALLDATPRIADAAAKLGMVPAGDSAMLMVNEAGAGSVVGEPSQVPGPPPPPSPAPAAAPTAAASNAAQATPAPTDATPNAAAPNAAAPTTAAPTNAAPTTAAPTSGAPAAAQGGQR
ncbi:hypothetical protein ACVBEQ_17735 [Nakamurella sp. GG22]